jgi:hypothetical protein
VESRFKPKQTISGSKLNGSHRSAEKIGKEDQIQMKQLSRLVRKHARIKSKCKPLL